MRETRSPDTWNTSASLPVEPAELSRLQPARARQARLSSSIATSLFELTESDVRRRRPLVGPIGVEHDSDGRCALDHVRGGQHHDVVHPVAASPPVAALVLDPNLRHSGPVRFMPSDLRHGRGDWSALVADFGTARVRACLLRRLSQHAILGGRLAQCRSFHVDPRRGSARRTGTSPDAEPDRGRGSRPIPLGRGDCYNALVGDQVVRAAHELYAQSNSPRAAEGVSSRSAPLLRRDRTRHSTRCSGPNGRWRRARYTHLAVRLAAKPPAECAGPQRSSRAPRRARATIVTKPQRT